MDELNHWLLKHVRVIYSPFRELLTSLHVLYRPAHHLTRLAWAEEMKSNMSQTLLESLYFFGQLSNEWLNFLDLDDYLQIEEKHVEEAIERLKQMSLNEFTAFLLGNRTKLPASERTSTEAEVFQKPAYFRKALCDFLYDYHQHHFARELYRVEPWLVKSVHELNHAMKSDPFEALGGIHPRFKLDQKAFKFYKAETWIFPYEDIQSLTVYPSSFIAPHLLVGLEQPHIIVYLHVTLPAEKTIEEAVPEDLLSVLAALKDKSRLRLLKRMYHHPYCTQQLIDLTGLSKATISKHLKILEKAELITSQRHGYFVFYKTNQSKLDQLKVELNQFFDQPLLGQKEEI